MKKAKKGTTKKVKHEKAEEAPVETVVPGAAESPATPPIAEFAFEAQAAPAEVAEQAAATPETPAYEEDRTTGVADDGEVRATPEVAAMDANTEACSEEATAGSAQTAATEAAVEPAPGKEKLSTLDLPALQSRYAEILGRGTNSTSRAYMVWRIREAQKGKVRIGPRLARAHDAEPTKVLPLRVPAAAVAPLDEVRRRLGLRSRNEMIHKAMAAFLINAGESDLAGHFGATFAPDDADAE